MIILKNYTLSKIPIQTPLLSGNSMRVGIRSILFNTESPESKTVPVDFKINKSLNNI